jgi:putative protease
MSTELELGTVTHVFNKIGVAAIDIEQDSLKLGDTIHVKGRSSDFTQRVDSMQLDHQPVIVACCGQSVGIRVAGHVHEHDRIYKVVA